MAEFQEVMRQTVRMCKSFGASCNGCKLHFTDGVVECPFYSLPDTWNISEMRDVERIIMQWAAEHPEHVYPSWQEAWKQLFPHGQGSPCPVVAYGMEFEPEGCGEISCAECKARHMHAKVAEKLGVKPVEVRRDA